MQKLSDNYQLWLSVARSAYEERQRSLEAMGEPEIAPFNSLSHKEQIAYVDGLKQAVVLALRWELVE